MRVFVEDSDPSIELMFENNGWEVSKTHEGVDLICFGGGDDVSPGLYNEANRYSHCNVQRDLYCMFLWNYANLNNIPCVGICRGGQFLNVMNGGKMIQHFEGHLGSHSIQVDAMDGCYKVLVTSTHHQVMVPSDSGELLGWANKDLNQVEIVYYDGDWKHNTGSLCFQPHPEYVGVDHECQQLFFKLINNYLM